MSKILLMGHGNFASGLKSVLDLVVGSDENILVGDFTQDKTPEIYKDEIIHLLKDTNNSESIYCFSDILGGTPFKLACELKSEGLNIEVFSGINIPMLIETAINIKCGLDINTIDILNVGKDSVFYYKIKENIGKESVNTLCEEGI